MTLRSSRWQYYRFARVIFSRESPSFSENPALDAEEVLASSIKQYYGSAAFVPKEVLVSRPIEQPQLIEAWLSEMRGNKVTVRVPLRGQGERLMHLALKNAEDALLREAQKDSVEKSLERIASKLHLPSPPRLIEGYDISNISGSQPVGVKVSFKDGAPEKSGYRKYKIQGFPDQDDPGMIHQTITRRVSHRDQEPLPDLFLIDGGKSQLNAASQALRENPGDGTAAIAAIAKARAEGEEERFYLPNRKNPVVFPRGDSGLMLLMRVRDEAHRFAHTFHTKSRTKAVISSALDQIPGIGPKKRQALLRAFGSVRKLLAATDEDIAAVAGIGQDRCGTNPCSFQRKTDRSDSIMNEILHQAVHSRTTMPPVNVLGVSVDRLTPDTLIEQVLALNPGDKTATVMYANIHVLNTSRRDGDLRPILNDADIVVLRRVRSAAWGVAFGP